MSQMSQLLQVLQTKRNIEKSEITNCGDIDFSMPKIEEVFTHYEIWEGLQNFRNKTGALYPKRVIKREDRYCANCIKFEENNPYFISTYSEPDENTCKKILQHYMYPFIYSYILIELPELLYIETAMQNDGTVEIHKPYLVECEQHSGIVIIKNFMKGPYYVFEQNNGCHILILDAHIQLLNDKEKRYLGV